MSTIEPGIYRIFNHFTPIVIDLEGGKSDDKTKIAAWHDDGGFNQAWLILLAGPASDTFVIRNITGGSYMDLEDSKSANGTPILGYHETRQPNQEWVIRKSGEWYKIQNNATKTFLDLFNGGKADGTKIGGWEGDWNAGGGHQAWDFKRISLHAKEIQDILLRNQWVRQTFKSFPTDSPYLLLPDGLMRDIWRSTSLGSTPWRSEIWDCDDFALAYKKAVAEWGAKNFKADGFAVMCGVMYGARSLADGHAYNMFIIGDKMDTVMFLEPQDGVTSDRPPSGDYKGYFGFF